MKKKIILHMSGSNDLTLLKAKHGGYYLHGNIRGYYSSERCAVVLLKTTGGEVRFRVAAERIR
jgi:hypothetical protein